MMTTIKIFIIILITCSIMQAQENLNPVEMPTSPASAVLGLQPNSVLSPKSYQALEAALFSNFVNSTDGIVIPNDFSLEFTPYWTADHSLSLEDYLYPNDILNDQIIRNSSFSLASTQKFLLGDSSETNSLALGYRTTLYFGNKGDREKVAKFRQGLSDFGFITSRINAEAQSLVINEKVKNKSEFLKSIRVKVEEVIRGYYPDEQAESIIEAIFREAASIPEFKDEGDEMLDAFNPITGRVLKSDELFSEFKSYIRDRQGLSLDFAYAAFLNFPTNQFEFSVVPRQSLWITPSYRFSEGIKFLKIMGVLRYEWYNTDYYRSYFPQSQFYENNVDYGLAVAGVFEKFMLQFELVGRSSNSEIPAGEDGDGNELFKKESNSDIQYVGTFSYLLTDDIALTYSLGKRFDPVLNPDNTLVSLLSINFGFGGATSDDIQLEN